MTNAISFNGREREVFVRLDTSSDHSQPNPSIPETAS